MFLTLCLSMGLELALQVLLQQQQQDPLSFRCYVYGDCKPPQSLHAECTCWCWSPAVLPLCTPCSATPTVLGVYRWLPPQVHTLRAELDAVNDDRLRLRGDLAEVKEQVRGLPLRPMMSSTYHGIGAAL